MRLFFLGASTLFLELVFIRYLAGNIWNLGYFPNMVLLAVFIGMGLGFLANRRLSESQSTRLLASAWAVILGLVAMVFVLQPSVPGFGFSGWSVGSQELFFTAVPTTGHKLNIVPFVAVFLAVIATAAMISQRTGKMFQHFSPLRAYTLDIGGSIAGILGFMAMSFLQMPAWVWFLVAGLLFLPTLSASPRTRAGVAVAVLVTSAIAWLEDQRPTRGREHAGMPLQVTWSPYQKVEQVGMGRVLVNGIDHQGIIASEGLRQTFYSVPHKRRQQQARPPYENVLIIGAGSGNDVATALMYGAKHVDAVEIDPVIANIGKRSHPAKPYDDPRVNLVIDDGRAFLQRTSRRYDLVIFALTDSLVKASGMSQLRLENYLFTVESVRRAFSLLRPGGEIVLYNFYREWWLVNKLLDMGRAATHRQPEIFYRQNDFVMFAMNEATTPLGIRDAIPRMDVPTDDWPFLYLRERGVPYIYSVVTGVVALVVLGGFLLLQAGPGGLLKQLAAQRRLPVAIAFLLMGTAFLLLETKSIVQFSLLFGTTWLNSSLVFLAILAQVLAANWLAHLVRSKRLVPVAGVLLLGSCLVSLYYPLGNLLKVESGLERFFFASLLTFSPIFFANLLFSSVFRDEHELSDQMFGWNMIGAVLGGLLEYRSMALGYQKLGWLVLLCYLATCLLLLLVFSRRKSVPAHAAAESP